MSYFPIRDDERLLPIRSARQIKLDGTRASRKPSAPVLVARLQEMATQKSENIFFSWTTLNGILRRHEPTIQNRWRRKSKEERLSILRKTYPGIPSRHRPDIEAMRQKFLGVAVDKAKQRTAYLRPYINEDDLSGDRSILLFLHSRGRNQPRMFAQSDFHHAMIGIQIAETASYHLEGFILALKGETAEEYGQCGPEMDGLWDCPWVFRTGDGMLILEIQEGIYHFLVRWCHAILEDIEPSSLAATMYPIETKPPEVPDDSDHLASDAMSRDNPYRLPAALDIHRLMLVSSAKRADAADHVLALRDDPAYFRETVQQFSEHRRENILNSAGRPDPSLGSTAFWDKVITTVIIDAYSALSVWIEIDNQVNKLARVQKICARVINPDQQLPLAYRKELLQLLFILEKSTAGPWYNLENGVQSSPNLRSYWIRQSQATQSKDPSNSYSDPLLWIFGTMWENFQPHLVLPDLLDELKRVTQTDETQNNRLSTWVAGFLNEAGAIVNLRRELTTYWPWAYSLQKTDYDQYEEELKVNYSFFHIWLGSIITLCHGLSCASLGTPSARLFDYPSDKMRTKKVVKTMQKAEKNLDAFWESIDSQVKKRTAKPGEDGETLEERMRQLFHECKYISRERTPDWVDQPPLKKNQNADGNKTNTTAPIEFRVPLASQDVNAPIDSSTIGKEKVKTRGKAITILTDPESLPLANLGVTQKPIFKVTSRVYKVFSTIFFIPSPHSQPGELAWTNFFHAMKYIGFRPEKCDGSAWHFIPAETMNVTQSIHFHEPHPKSKIPFVVARQWGIKFSRRYGWSGANFEEI